MQTAGGSRQLWPRSTAHAMSCVGPAASTNNGERRSSTIRTARLQEKNVAVCHSTNVSGFKQGASCMYSVASQS
eukprot:1138698-Pleurochrysis_carterae.AAC.1